MHLTMSLASLAFLVVATSAAPLMASSCCRNNCPDGSQWHDNKCYTIAPSRMTWSEANDYCYSKEAYMAKIKSRSDFEFLQWLMPSNESSGGYMWLQATSRHQATVEKREKIIHQYEWADGSLVDKKHFNNVIYNDMPCHSIGNSSCRLSIAKDGLSGVAVVTQNSGIRKLNAVCVIKEPTTRFYRQPHETRLDPVAQVMALELSTAPVTRPLVRGNVWGATPSVRLLSPAALSNQRSPGEKTTVPSSWPVVATTEEEFNIHDTYLFQTYDKAASLLPA